MIISDEKLSAFLDTALPEPEMAQIREQLSRDQVLADRLADLAMVDQLVRQHSAAINEVPVPDSILALLDEPSSAVKDAQILTFPWWRRRYQQFQQHAAVAALIALFVGYGAAQLLPGELNDDNHWSNIAQVLETQSSGKSWPTGSNIFVEPRLTFQNHQGDICRQYHLSSPSENTENIACRQAGDWQLKASIVVDKLVTENYQTASGGSVLDSVLDRMMTGPAITADKEQTLLKSNWQ